MAIPSSAVDGPVANVRMEQLGVKAEELREAMQIGYAAAAGCTEHDPRSLPGTLAWGKGMGHLRDLTKPRGWTADSASNYETTVHPSNTHGVAIAAGTAETGRTDGLAPRTKTPKGPATSRAVARNAQLSLAQGTDAFRGTGEPVEDKDRKTWILLHYYDKDLEEIRLELSLPLEMSGKQITAWSERLIIPPLVFSSEIEIEDLEADVPIEIDVSRRATEQR
jgi:hypothetical protein